MRKQLKDHGAERRTLRKIKARPQPNSGSTPGMPNDGVKGKYLIEVKSTINYSVSIKRKWLDDLEENAMLRGKIPALIVVFQDFMTTAVPAQEWVAVPLRDFEKLSLGWRTR